MEKFLIFRTDRVGDFLLSLILIKNIKKRYSNSEITIIASENNSNYIKSFHVIDRVIILRNNFLSKIKLIFELRKYYYDTIIVHDGKNRSKFVSYFLKYKKRILCKTDLINSQFDIIKKVCTEMRLDLDNECINFLDDRIHNITKLPFNNYVHLHFDEKWFYNEYIKKYINIEPSQNELLQFIDNIISKDKNLIITTGKNSSELIEKIKEKIDESKIRIYEKQSLIEIENIVFKSDLLIACHGWISHIASAKKVKQIDIIDDSYPYHTWTSHFRNYQTVKRKTFNLLSKEIISFL